MSKFDLETIILSTREVVYAKLNEKAKCKRCGFPIIWAIDKKSKSVPISIDKNGNWSKHQSNCFEYDMLGRGDTLDEIKLQSQRDRRSL